MNKPIRMDFSKTDASTPFSKMVDEDIQRCDNYLSGEHDEQKGYELHLELISKYPQYIPDFGTSLLHYDAKHGFTLREYFDLNAAINNLTVIKSKLIAFKNFGYKSPSQAVKHGSPKISIENTLTSTQTQTTVITFDEVKHRVKEMSGLSDSETEETLKKVDEIKAIVELQEPPKSKWQKIKPILVWLSDKSVDVGIALLPLLLKIAC